MSPFSSRQLKQEEEKNSSNSSFTLLELLITIGIIAVLLTVIVFSLSPKNHLFA